jgi:uncharacterized protein YbjT (DUF2867 family)
VKIVITSANSATGLLLVPALKAAGHYTIGLVRKPVAIAADEVITDWMNAAAARQALAGADVIVHLSGELNAKNARLYASANRDTARVVADNARAGRLVYLSYPHASSQERNYYLRYKGEAEELLHQTGIPLVIFRCPVIIDAPDKASKIDVLFKSQKGRPVPVIGSGRQLMRPVYRGTVVGAIVSALRKGRPGVYELSGPDEMTVDEFIRLANPQGVRLLHIPGWLAFTLSRVLPGLSSTFVDMMLHHTSSTYDPATYREFGIGPVSISEIWGSKRRI